MRIIAGKYRKRTLPSPKGFTARPTTDFAKENLFNVINNWYDFDDLEILDLFAGTGGISYEFASRGCKKVTTVEQSHRHYTYINQMITLLGIKEIDLIRGDAFKFMIKTKQKYDLIFADPPYDLKGIETIPDLIFNNELLLEKGSFILEHSKDYRFSSHPRFSELRTYGSVNFSVFE